MALTDKQKIFIDTFCDAIEGGLDKKKAYSIAKETAGYSDTTSRRDIITDEMATELQSYANRHLVMGLPEALQKFDSLLTDPEQGGAAVLLNTLNSWFDRGGVIKKESKEIVIKAPTGIVVMPSKAPLDEE